MADKKVIKKKKQKKNIISGLAYISATFNNTMVTITAVSYTHLTLPAKA